MQGKIHLATLMMLALVQSGCASRDTADIRPSTAAASINSISPISGKAGRSKRHRIVKSAAATETRKIAATKASLNGQKDAVVDLPQSEERGLKERTKDSVLSAIQNVNGQIVSPVPPTGVPVQENAAQVASVPVAEPLPVPPVQPEAAQTIPPLGLASQDWPSSDGEGFRFHATMVRKKLADARPDLAGQEAKKAIAAASTPLEKIEAQSLLSASYVMMGRETGSVTSAMPQPVGKDWLALEAARSGIVNTAPQVSVSDAVSEVSSWPSGSATLVVPYLSAASKTDAAAASDTEKLAERLNRSSNVDNSVVELTKGYSATAAGNYPTAFDHFTKASTSKYALVSNRAKAEAKEAGEKSGAKAQQASPAVSPNVPSAAAPVPAIADVAAPPQAATSTPEVTAADEALLDPAAAAGQAIEPETKSGVQSAKEAIDSADKLLESYKKDVK